MKVSKKDLQLMFNRLCKVMNKTNWQLDHIACYGGYIVEENLVDGGVSHPLMSRRLPAKEMYSALYMACLASELAIEYTQRHS